MKNHIEITAKTGEKCPQGGIWNPVDEPDKTRAIGIGNRMPPTQDGDTLWVLKMPTGDDQPVTRKANSER